MAIALALYGQYKSNNKLERFVKTAATQQGFKDYADCISRKDARDAIRDLILLIEQSPLVSDQSKALMTELLFQLPPTSC